MTPENVLDYWLSPRDHVGKDHPKNKLWWGKDPAIDAEIRERFGPALAAARAGELEHWKQTPEGTLAFIIVCDQMSRNMHRDTAEMYAADDLAVAAARQLFDSSDHEALRPLERQFAAMPFMHSEDPAVHEMAAPVFERIAEDMGAPAIADYAVRHREIVDRFGRYPHRNAILGRQSTDEELAFLEQPGSSF